MRKLMIPVLVVSMAGCGDFVDEDGNTSIRQVAEGLQSLGEHVAAMGEAIERDAGVEAVPWEDLASVLPDELAGTSRLHVEGEDATDREGAGLSMAHADFVVRGDSAFVGVADLGALRSGAQLALRWIAPVFARGEIDGDIEDIDVEGFPALRIRDDDGDGMLVAMLVEGRFAVLAGASGRGMEDELRRALRDVDFDRLEDWVDYGVR